MSPETDLWSMSANRNIPLLASVNGVSDKKGDGKSPLGHEVDWDAELGIMEEESGGVKTKFPPLCAKPSLCSMILMVLLLIGFVLCVTAFRDGLDDQGVSTRDLLQFGSIPVVSVLFTYAHIWAALWMTFYPINFFGCCQIPGTNTGLGWQGIIPFKAEKMARTACRLMTERLLKVEEIFARLNPTTVTEQLRPVVKDMLYLIIDEVGQREAPEIWSEIPERIKAEIVDKAEEDQDETIHGILEDVRQNITNVFDLEHMVVAALTSDREMLNRMFIKCGYNELAFIRDSGAWMGFIFGVVQMVLYIFYDDWWVLPAFGFVVGVLTNWLALQMIFRPINPKKCCCCTLQGLFLKRQKEVADVYARTVTSEVLTSKKILSAMLSGPFSERLIVLVQSHCRRALDEFAGASKTLITMTIGTEVYDDMQQQVCDRLVEILPLCLSEMEEYTEEALDLENTLRTKMEELPAEDFEGLLHPIFEEDEWKLVLMGGVLGVVIGMFQAFALQ